MSFSTLDAKSAMGFSTLDAKFDAKLDPINRLLTSHSDRLTALETRAASVIHAETLQSFDARFVELRPKFEEIKKDTATPIPTTRVSGSTDPWSRPFPSSSSATAPEMIRFKVCVEG